MKAGSRIILCILTFYAHTITTTAESDPSYRVNAMNDMFSHPDWPALSYYGGFDIAVRWTDETDEEKYLTLADLLATVDDDGPTVTYDNVQSKIRQTHQFLSCQYADSLKVLYDYTFGVIQQCKKIYDPVESADCITDMLDTIRKIDHMVVRMTSTLSAVYKLSPEPFDQDVTEILDDFKSFYVMVNFDSESLELEHHEEIIDSTEDHMEIVIGLLAEFYDDSCAPISDEEEYGISDATQAVQVLEDQYPAPVLAGYLKEMVSTIVDEILDKFDQLSLGFRYDPSSTITHITYDP